MLFESLETRRLYAVLVGTQLQVTGGAGNDTIKVSQQDAATIRVEQNGGVTFFADNAVGSILINGNAGNDTLQMLTSVAFPLTEPGTINGGTGNDNMLGAEGNDILNGGDGNDNMTGGKGNDSMDAGTGTNNLSGGDGNDQMTAGTGKDVFNGGAGTDSVSYATRTAGLNITLDNVANDGQLFIGLPLPTFENDNVQNTVENVTTGSGNDIITASTTVAANNVFTGGAGNDRLTGLAGNDRLFGGDGNDTALGGAGSDVISGGNGNDFLFGGDGNDNLLGDAGDDYLSGGLGFDALSGGDGNDILNTLDGGADAAANGGNGFDILEKDAADPAGISVEVTV
jgi:Ca2+-binding RTX toxin-like protein